MEINVVSYNVRGLNSRKARIRLKSFLKEVHCNIVFIQEHKLRVINDRLLSTQIWKNGVLYTAPAKDGVHALRNPLVYVGEGGLAIGVPTAIAPLVSNVTISPCGRAIMLHVDDPLGIPFGLLNIYGPNSAVERTELWEYLSIVIDADRPWLVGGDFNMVLTSADQLGGAPTNLTGTDNCAWEDLASLLNLVDTHLHQATQLKYTWDNNRVDPPEVSNSQQVLKRLDRFYLSLELFMLYPVAHTETLAAQTMSDHIPIQLVLEAAESQRRARPFRVQAKHLSNEQL